MIGSFADDANVLFRARGAGAIIVPRLGITDVGPGDRRRGLSRLYCFLFPGVSDNKADGIKNGIKNESPHFMRTNSIELRTL